jgi:hypothetical protein
MIEIDRHQDQPQLVEIVLQLLLDRAAFLSGHQAASDETLERVRDLELMNYGERYLAGGPQYRFSRVRELLGDVERHYGA